ncbi:MAG: methyltransferase [Bacteroidota bacterium]
MPNNYFQFKQFTIHQDDCAMKVCTDSCLFGAYIATNYFDYKNILDIGTGTGLLSLMLAQKTIAQIDAVEIDDKAFLQAQENFNNSPWKERVNIFNADINLFKPEKKYDFIISNPPFFEDDLRSENKEKNTAKHDTDLTLKKLLEIIAENLSDKGKAALLLPYSRSNDLLKFVKTADLFIHELVSVKQTPKHNYFRVMAILGKEELKQIKKTIVIKDEDNQYTTDFVELLKDYYLHL